MKYGRTIRKIVVGWTCSMESRMINSGWADRSMEMPDGNHLIISSFHHLIMSCPSPHVPPSFQIPDSGFRIGRTSSCRCVLADPMSVRFPRNFVSTLPGAARGMHDAWFGISIARCGCHHLSLRCIREASVVLHWTFSYVEPYGFECSD